ncbi:MAG: hypothetical protein ACI4S1_07630 [Roseburia sp.]
MSREQKEQGIELRERICQYISNYINDMGYSPTVIFLSDRLSFLLWRNHM